VTTIADFLKWKVEREHGFLDSNGTFSTIDFPDVVGFYSDSSGLHGWFEAKNDRGN
jgi:hypothetical protein